MVFRFPVKIALPKHAYLNGRVIKDHFKRTQVAEHEVTRNALKYIARNTELPARARVEAQLQLTSMPNYTRPTQIVDRCIASGNARSVVSDFKLNRTAFRNRARLGQIPGVKKASW
ncbi:37S ribosomal protein Mrp2p, mitochondrial [[Candida] railenensis]|uniref:37S ribosomal protein MRP2, mitochondrial n=1 Tax=[Candida] railenensis TaxID=45579 RepID=A0A9P0QNX6_9ASCO|nr:37S ribosomal protein Mrp2p, mitochondrial [[Candida] railenensis]